MLKGTPNRYSSGGSGARASGTANDASPTTSPSQQLSSQLPRDEFEDNPELPSTQGANGIQSEETSSSLTVALSKITSLLNTVVKRVERVEAELKNVNQSSPSSSDSTPSGDKKIHMHVPRVVRVRLLVHQSGGEVLGNNILNAGS